MINQANVKIKSSLHSSKSNQISKAQFKKIIDEIQKKRQNKTLQQTQQQHQILSHENVINNFNRINLRQPTIRNSSVHTYQKNQKKGRSSRLSIQDFRILPCSTSIDCKKYSNFGNQISVSMQYYKVRKQKDHKKQFIEHHPNQKDLCLPQITNRSHHHYQYKQQKQYKTPLSGFKWQHNPLGAQKWQSLSTYAKQSRVEHSKRLNKYSQQRQKSHMKKQSVHKLKQQLEMKQNCNQVTKTKFHQVFKNKLNTEQSPIQQSLKAQQHIRCSLILKNSVEQFQNIEMYKQMKKKLRQSYLKFDRLKDLIHIVKTKTNRYEQPNKNIKILSKLRM